MKKRSMKLVGLSLATLGALLSGGAMAHASKPQVESQGGIKVFNAADSAYWFSVGGRLNLDETQFSGKRLDKRNDFPSGGNIRRAFLKLAGGVGEYLTYNLTLDFSGNNGQKGTNGSTVDFEDAWINASTEYTGPLGVANLRFGQFTPPTSIDDAGNHGTQNDNVFLESALATQAFSMPSKVFGLWGDISAMDTFVLSGAVYHPRQNNDTKTSNNVASANNYQNQNRSDRIGTSLRLTFVPVHTEGQVFHVGAIGRYQSMNHESQGANKFQKELFSTGPEARARNTGLVVNTGDIRAKSYNVATAEMLGIYGPATVEAEYYRANVQRVPTTANTAGNPRFHGWHVQGGYLLTGEARNYDFATGTLRNPTAAATCGAWEVTARFSYVNLAHRDLNGGSEHNTTVGLNWFVNENVRLGANYIRANIRTSAMLANQAVFANAPVKRKLDIVGLRLGVMF